MAEGVLAVMETIPKAPLSDPERYASALGLAAAGLVVGGAAALAPGNVWAVLLVAAAVALGAALVPGQRLRYQYAPQGLKVGREWIPFRSVRSARVVRLDGTLLVWGLSLPGFWWGTAWSPALGRVMLRASTGMGQGVLLGLADGRRCVITPADPVALVVRIHMLIGPQRLEPQR